MNQKSFDDALKIWEEIEAGVKPGSELWYEAKYTRAKCYFEKGQKQQGADIINVLKATNPAMGGPEMKQRFEDLLNQNK
jgi:hypothetical protein